MPREKKAKKLIFSEGFSVGEDNGLKVSLGELFGKETPKSNDTATSIDSSSSCSPAVSKNSTKDLMQKLGKVTLQRQTAGHGGKTVTVVMFSKEAVINFESLAKDMRKGLGCGSHVEERRIILQGDMCERAEDWLIKKGVKHVVIGN